MSYYSDLNVLPTASMKEIEVAYNNLNLQDLSMDDKIKINKAYYTLSDYNSRRKYDNLMEEIKSIVAYNDKCNFLDISNFEIDDPNDNTNLDNTNLDNNLINDEVTNNNDIIDHLDKMFSDINSRLENIEKRLYQKESNNNSFYKERKKINTFYSKGKKVVNILTDINRDGNTSSKLKTISYDSDGNEEITYKTLRKKKAEKNT